jgi:alkaline phosphatase D
MKIDRRRAVSLLALTGAAPFEASAANKPVPAVAVAFKHGVASGDPLQDRVILWTRVTPAAPQAVSVMWEVAEDTAFKLLVAYGTAKTTADRDFTVKADAGGLKPGREYFYRFRVGAVSSPVGRTKTLPNGATDKVVLAFATCALFPAGYFNAYDHIAKLERVDAVVELGDYYYEYGGTGSYGYEAGKKMGRVAQPEKSIVTLADYRTRHAQYKSDVDLQAAHARAPWICVWDDHETANDSWVGGAQHHDPKTEGPWVDREQAAMRAYYEWMPIREPEPGRAFEAINRSFQFGDLASLIMVETRLVARSKQMTYENRNDVPLVVYDSADPATRKIVTDKKTIARVLAATKDDGVAPEPYVLGPDIPAFMAKLNDPLRQMLGVKQEEWLKLEVANSVASGRPWQIFGNQVVMARVRGPDIVTALGAEKMKALYAAVPDSTRGRLRRFVDFFSFDVPYDLDGWDGYPAARERMYDAIKASNANAVVVSGDSHAFWVNELYDADGKTRVAAEFGATSVTSPSLGNSFKGIDIAKMFMDQNKEVLFNDQLHHGYVLLTVTKENVTGELVATEIAQKPYASSVVGTWRVSPADGPGIGDIVKV